MYISTYSKVHDTFNLGSAISEATIDWVDTGSYEVYYTVGFGEWKAIEYAERGTIRSGKVVRFWFNSICILIFAVICVIELCYYFIVRKTVDTSENILMKAVSHDLKKPLNTLKIEVAKWQEADGEEKNTCARDIMTQVGRMDSVIRRQLKLRDFESRRIDLRMEEVNLYSLARSVIREQKDILAERHLEIVLDSEPQYSFVRADKLLLELVIENMINVAADYSEEKIVIGLHNELGDVRLRVICDSEDLQDVNEKLMWKNVTHSDVNRINYHGTDGVGLATMAPVLAAQGARYGCDKAEGGLVLWFGFKRFGGEDD